MLELLSNSEFFRTMVSRKTHPKGMVFLMLWKICKNPEKKKPGKIYRPVGSPHFCPLDVPKKKYVKSIHWRKPNWKRLPTSSSPGSWSHGSSPTGIPRPIDCHLFFVRSSNLSNILQKIRIMIFRIQKIRQTLDSQRRDCCHRYCSTLLWRHHDTRV